MKKSFGKTIVATLIGVTLTMGYVPKSHALLPTTDYANLTETIAGNIQKIQQWAEEKGLEKIKMNFQSVLAELNIDNMNNAIANVISRSGRAMQDVQNLDLLEKSAPDGDACETISLQLLGGDVLCMSADNSNAAVAETMKKHTSFDKPVAEQMQAARDIAEYTVNRCKELSGGSGSLDDTMCVRGDLLSGGASGTLSDEEAEASELFNELLVGTIPVIKKANDYDKDSSTYLARLNAEMTHEAFRSLVATSVNEVSSMYKSPGRDGAGPLPSPMDVLQEFDNNRFGSVEWMSALQNVDKNVKNSVMISQVTRKIAVMESFQIHLELIKMKQQLRMESLLAALVRLELDPPGKL